jgi:MSHA biogenesis protein MshQ
MAAYDLDTVNVVAGTNNHTKIGNTEIRYGRIALSNAHGSELLDLPVTMTAQYWNGSWIRNMEDTSTSGVTLALTDVTPTDGLVPSETCVFDSGNPGVSGIGCSTAGIAPKRFIEPPVGADFRLWLKAPGAGNWGALNLTATVPAWLRFNWKGAGDVNPSARVTFGVNAAKKSPIIYLRENY